MGFSSVLKEQRNVLSFLTHRLPESVTKHVHDIQQSLDTQVPGKVIKLGKEQGRGYNIA